DDAGRLAVARARAGVRVGAEEPRVPAALHRLVADGVELVRLLADGALALVQGRVAAELGRVEVPVRAAEREGVGPVGDAREARDDGGAVGDRVRAGGAGAAGARRRRAPADAAERDVVAVAAGLVRAAARGAHRRRELRVRSGDERHGLRIARADGVR